MRKIGEFCRFQWAMTFGDVRKRPPLLPTPPPGEPHWHVRHGVVTKYCKDPACPGSEPYVAEPESAQIVVTGPDYDRVTLPTGEQAWQAPPPDGEWVTVDHGRPCCPHRYRVVEGVPDRYALPGGTDDQG